MTEMKLTKMQIEYLLFLKNNPRKRTITDASKYFDCSKVNAKKIMDRMLVLGLLYKDTNDFHLTMIGEKFANEYNEILEDSKTILRYTLKMDDEEVLKVSDELIHLENIREIIKDYSSHIKKIEKLKNKVKNEELLKVYSNSSSDIYLTVYKVSENNKNSFVENSMAMMGFEKEVEIIVEDEEYLCLKTKMIEKIQNGFKKKSMPIFLLYEDEHGEHTLDVKEGMFRIPLKIIKFWNNLGSGILQTSVNLKIKTQIGFAAHIGKANFVFSVNLY